MFSMFLQKENKTQAALGSKPSQNTTYTFPNRQGKCCNRVWQLWTGTNGCKLGFSTKVFMPTAVTMLYQLFVSCRYISLLVLLHSSWKGRQSWSMLGLSRGELCTKRLLKCRAPSCLFFSSLSFWTVSTFVLPGQVQRQQDFLLFCSLFSNLLSLQSPVKSAFYIPWWKLSPSWRAIILQEHTPCEAPP